MNLRYQDEEKSKWTVPVTLRQIEEAKIELDSKFGYDEEEHEQLLDENDLMRICFELNIVENDGLYEVADYCYIECSEYSMIKETSVWTNCMKSYDFTSGNKTRIAYENNQNCVEALLRKIEPAFYDGVLLVRRRYESEVDKWNKENTEALEMGL